MSDDEYPPEEAAARMDAMMNAIAGRPPKDEAEAALRKQIADEMDARFRPRPRKKEQR